MLFRSRKAIEAAEIIAAKLNVDVEVREAMHENDRSATGYLPKQEFEATVDAFFAQPQTSVRGWESAVNAQARIVRTIEQIVSQALGNDVLAIVGHGGTGTLLYCHLAGLPISRCHEQPATNGGNWFAFD